MIAPTIPRLTYSWRSQAKQHPAKGAPGIRHHRHTMPDGQIIDCLFHRSLGGELVGILYRYPDGSRFGEKPGAVNLLVRPNRQRRGIGRALLHAAMDRWPVDPEAQDYTPGGAALMAAVLAERS